MKFASFSSQLTGQMSHFEAQALMLDDPRPHPPEEALIQLGHSLMTELLDLFGETALEDYQTIVSETLDRGVSLGEPADRTGR